jgi:transcriptional regulator with XRE-family HTH domain
MYEIFEQLLQKHGITPYKLSKEIDVSQSTLSDWKRGRSTPKQDKLQKIADYFGVTIDYLMNGEEKEEKPYFLDDDARKIAEELSKNPDLHILFDAARTVSAEDLKFVVDMVNRLKQGKE